MKETDVVNYCKNDKDIRKIEDIIDMQKANGTLDKVVNIQPERAGTTKVTHSLDSGFSSKQGSNKKSKTCRYPNYSSEVVWPSDSDITVLRMKLLSTSHQLSDDKNPVLGDGLHVPDSYSMVNLATLMLEQPPSKHLKLERLIPLSSWAYDKKKDEGFALSRLKCNQITSNYEIMRESAKSKWARFLRLYFCPCCSCLYKLEEYHDEPMY